MVVQLVRNVGDVQHGITSKGVTIEGNVYVLRMKVPQRKSIGCWDFTFRSYESHRHFIQYGERYIWTLQNHPAPGLTIDGLSHLSQWPG